MPVGRLGGQGAALKAISYSNVNDGVDFKVAFGRLT